MHGTAQWARRAVNEFGSLVAEAFHQRAHGSGLFKRFHGVGKRISQHDLCFIAFFGDSPVCLQFAQQFLFVVYLAGFFSFFSQLLQKLVERRSPSVGLSLELRPLLQGFAGGAFGAGDFDRREFLL